MLEFEAAFQRHNERIVEFAEEIHFLKGIDTEIAILDESYCSLYGALCSLSGYEWVCAVTRNYIVRYLGILASFCSLLPMISTEKQPTEFLLNNLHDLVQIGLAFRDLMRSAKEFDAVKGISVRINDLDHVLNHYLEQSAPQRAAALFEPKLDAESQCDDDDEYEDERFAANPMNSDLSPKSVSHREALCFEEVSIETPDRSKVLMSALNLSINLGQNLVISGPNGSGKSSLYRVVSGLWQCTKGRIRVKVESDDIGFLSSRSYLVPGLSIKEQVLYPDVARFRSLSAQSQNEEISDETVIEILNECGLGKLVDFMDDIDDSAHCTEQFWMNLSDGEKQLIALCRAILKKPKLLFVDEALSNLSHDRIHWFFKKLEAENITAVTITHCPDAPHIARYHKMKLTLSGDGRGSYSVERI